MVYGLPCGGGGEPLWLMVSLRRVTIIVYHLPLEGNHYGLWFAWGG